MVQGQAHQWIHVLVPALLAALRPLGEAPARSLTALAPRLGVSAADAAPVVTPLAAEPAPAVVPASPPVAHDGTERRSVRPHDPPAQTAGDRGKKTDHPVNNVLRVNAPLPILVRRETSGGPRHDTRIAEATPSPWPAGSRWWQDLGCLACTLPQVDILMPTKKPRGQALTLEQHVANQALPHRRRRIAHVHRRVTRCRIGQDRIRLWQEGVRDLVMDLGWALHNFRVRLTPWQPMV